MSDKVTALHIKTTLMSYFRFKRQWITVDECLLADVITDTGKEILEVEIKISKYDLWADMKKYKHKYRLHYKKYAPNRFYYCVPTELKEEAEKLVEELNSLYGIIVYRGRNDLWYYRKGKKLHEQYNDNFRWQIAKRCSAALISRYETILCNLSSEGGATDEV